MKLISQKNGNYKANFEGEITIIDKTKSLQEMGKVTVNGKTLDIDATFNLTLADCGISFHEGEIVSKKIEVIVKSE